MFTHEELMELRRALTVYIEWCGQRMDAAASRAELRTYTAKVEGAIRMQDDIDAVLYPDD